MGSGSYADINGIKMYYEVHGEGQPLVLIHGGGSTLATSFGGVLPYFAQTRMAIAVEMQAHGHTSDRDAPESFRQDAYDIAALLRHLNIPRADILGFSNGGQTGIELALRYPELVRSLVIASAFHRRDAASDAFWKGFETAQLSEMPQVYQDEFLKITGDHDALLNMFKKDVERMRTFTGWSDEDLRSISCPTVVVAGDRDLPAPEKAVEMFRLLPDARLMILPGGHGEYMGEIMSRGTNSRVPELFAAAVDEFLTSVDDAK
jgi:pimeloyl-ACP methyl ester carboxylesterase